MKITIGELRRCIRQVIVESMTSPPHNRRQPFEGSGPSIDVADREQIGTLNDVDPEEDIAYHLQDPDADDDVDYGPVPPIADDPYVIQDPYVRHHAVTPGYNQ